MTSRFRLLTDIDMYIDRPPRAGTAATWWPLSGLSKHRCGSPVINIIKAPSSAWLTKAELLSTWRTPLRRGLPSSLMAWPYRRSSLWGRTPRRGSGRSGTWSVERMTSSSPPIPNQVPEILSLKIIRHLLQRDKYEFSAAADLFDSTMTCLKTGQPPPPSSNTSPVFFRSFF